MSIATIISALRKHYGRPKPPAVRDPFDLILWENVLYLGNDEKRAAAFTALKKSIGTKPKQILEASDADLLAITRMGSIMPAMSAQKLRRIAEIAHYIFKDDLGFVLQKPIKQAMRDLRRFPSIGKPGAEKILLFTGTAPILALDSNGRRSLQRLGYGQEMKNYSASYRSTQEAVAPELPKTCNALIEIHQLLRMHGQQLCKASRPLCEDCPVSDCCAYFKMTRARN